MKENPTKKDKKKNKETTNKAVGIIEITALPYRPLELDELGAISPLKPVTLEEAATTEKNRENGDHEGFITPRKGTQKNNFVDKAKIFERIKSFKGGFETNRKLQQPQL